MYFLYFFSIIFITINMYTKWIPVLYAIVNHAGLCRLNNFSFSFFFPFCWFFVLVMRLTFRLAFRLDQLAVWGALIPIRLAARPTRSSYSVFNMTSFFGSDLGYLPAGFPAISWLMGLLGHPTQSPKCRFFQGFWWPTPAQWKVKGFSWRYYTLILAKRPRSDPL